MNTSLLSQLWLAGKTSAEIGLELGVAPSQVSAMVSNLRRTYPDKYPARNTKPRAMNRRKMIAILERVREEHGLHNEIALQRVIASLKATLCT